ncbi:MAG TPA: hypothetical protein VFD65_01870 [Chitinophagales bacterium]|nr:hypothetical protein [Chitinophagales bacterium]
MNSKLTKLKKLAQERPDDAFTFFALAKEYEKLNDLKKAIEIYSDIMKKDPDYIGLYYHLGKALEYDNQETEALSVYKKGILIAQKQNDLHTLSELKNAYQNLELEL